MKRKLHIKLGWTGLSHRDDDRRPIPLSEQLRLLRLTTFDVDVELETPDEAPQSRSSDGGSFFRHRK
jgi:hypothetical protein